MTEPRRACFLERVSVHAVPVGVGGHAEGAVAGRTASAVTEKAARVAGNLEQDN